MKNKFLLLMTFLLLSSGAIYSQTGIGTMSPDSSAILDVSSASKGFLLPRHSTESRDAIVSPAKGLMIFNVTDNELQTNTGTPTSPVWTASGIGATGPQGSAGSDATVTASNGLTISSGDVKLGGTLSSSTSINQDNNDFTLTTGTARTIINGNFQTKGLLYAKVPRVHPIASSITWQSDDVIILLQSTHTGNIVFPSASNNPNRLIGINNRSGSARIITNTSGGDTGIYYNEALTQIASASGVSWYVSDGVSWRLYAGRP